MDIKYDFGLRVPLFAEAYDSKRSNGVHFSENYLSACEKELIPIGVKP